MGDNGSGSIVEVWPRRPGSMVTHAQVEFTEAELLMDPEVCEPLIADGHRCHGGYDANGAYQSPRSVMRVPAIEAWESKRVAQFGTPLLDIPLTTWPESFPNVEQSSLLLRHGISDPTVGTLTRIGTIEGFGVILRHLELPDFSSCFDEDVRGTAIDHIGRGLFEAHARDEAGYGEEAGHNTMWFAARDIAFERPISEDGVGVLLKRMGLVAPPQGNTHLAPAHPATPPARILPDDIDPALETVVARMIGLLLIEISAFHGFRWAEGVLSDTDLVAGDGEAAELIRCIRADETPHVDWLRTALSEMRDRTWVGTSGRRYDGTEMITLLWERAISESLGTRRHEQIAMNMREIERATRHRRDADDLIDEMLSLGSVRRSTDGTLIDTSMTGTAVGHAD